jgi:starch synthase
MANLKILFASSEVAPFAKTGGLADVSASLPSALANLGHRVVIVMPLYRTIKQGGFDLTPFENPLEVPFNKEILKEKIFFTQKEKNPAVCFIQQDNFFDREALYATPEGEYPDNAERFIFFSRGILQAAKTIDFQPDIIHCNDWQTGLVSAYLKSLYKTDPLFLKTRVIFTIHNLAYQGLFSKEYMRTSELPSEFFSMDGIEYYNKMNFMKAGIVFADFITTVSEKYAHEIRTSEFGYGLEGVLENRQANLIGVLNGVDYSLWSPDSDPHIVANYHLKDLSGKRECKKDLMDVFQLSGSGEWPVIGMISRLADQKGFDILAEALDELMKRNLFLVILGKGDKKYEKQFSKIAEIHKGRVGVKIAFDNALAHKIEAGSDMFLMPSKYEPCGLNQMYSLKYGTIPIVRATGGLDDTISEFNPETAEGNGFKFSAYSASDLAKTIKRALYMYRNKLLWKKLVVNAMNEDFSWHKSAKKYEQIYRNALAKT